MEPRFNTSFIPKQSLSKETPQTTRTKSRGSGGLLMTFSLLLLVLSLVSAGGVFAYVRILESSISEKAQSLDRARDEFQPAQIRNFERLDRRIEAAGRVLSRHKAPTILFQLLGEKTLKSIRYGSMKYEDSAEGVRISLGGSALNFEAIALQSDVLGSDRSLQNSIISDLSASELVSFLVNSGVDERNLLYENRARDVLERKAAEAANSSPAEVREENLEEPVSFGSEDATDNEETSE